MLELDAIHRRFGNREVLGGVSLNVAEGRVQLVVGPNGSGKSTLARIAAGLLRPSGGAVRIGGHNPRTDERARRAIGFVAHQSLLYDDLTPRENLDFVARLYGVADRAAAVGRMLDRLVIGRERDVQLRRLSRGMVQRVALARALLHGPSLLILDEPFTGLDTPSATRLVGILDQARQEGVGVFVVSHELLDVWQLPASVAVLNGGKIRLSCDTTMLLGDFRTRYTEVLRG